MKNVFFALAFMLIGSSSFASVNIEEHFETTDLIACSISTTRTIDAANGDTHEVTVTNSGRTCFDAWSKNQDELDQFEAGIEPAR